MGLYRKATADELRGATVLLDQVETANKSKPAANKPRPGAKGRAELIATPEGRALLAKAKAELAEIVAPILKRGRPVKSTGDPKKDARNAQQRDLMRKRRAAK